MSEHTKEPWYHQEDVREVVGADGWTVLDWAEHSLTEGVTEMRPADVDRIVACVNALAGLKPEMVKALVEAVKQIVETNFYLKKEGGRFCYRCHNRIQRIRDHESDCLVGQLAALLAKVKVEK